VPMHGTGHRSVLGCGILGGPKRDGHFNTLLPDRTRTLGASGSAAATTIW
jgi:hypothetical protein